MSHFLFQDENEADNHMDIDELFEKRQQHDLKQLSIYNKILNRIHTRIKRISRAKSDTHLFYNVPEFIFGEQCYDNKDCTGYLVAKLDENGFIREGVYVDETDALMTKYLVEKNSSNDSYTNTLCIL